MHYALSINHCALCTKHCALYTNAFSLIKCLFPLSQISLAFENGTQYDRNANYLFLYNAFAYAFDTFMQILCMH